MGHSIHFPSKPCVCVCYSFAIKKLVLNVVDFGEPNRRNRTKNDNKKFPMTWFECEQPEIMIYKYYVIARSDYQSSGRRRKNAPEKFMLVLWIKIELRGTIFLFHFSLPSKLRCRTVCRISGIALDVRSWRSELGTKMDFQCCVNCLVNAEVFCTVCGIYVYSANAFISWSWMMVVQHTVYIAAKWNKSKKHEKEGKS